MNNSSAGSTRATASRNRRVSPASRSLIDAPSENATRGKADHMCAEERGAKATITHSDFVAIFPCQRLSRRGPDWACRVRAFSWLSQVRRGRDSVERFAHLWIGAALGVSPPTEASRAHPGGPELLPLPRA